MRDGFVNDKKRFFKWIKNDFEAPIRARRSGDRLCVHPGEVVTLVAEAWGRLYNEHEGQGIEWQPTQQRYAEAINELRSPCGPLPLFAPRMRKLLASTPSSAPGPDGWDVKELQALPEPLQDLLGLLLDEVERQSRWPDECVLARTAHIAKVKDGGEGDSPLPPRAGNDPLHPLATRPITVLPVIYRVWSSTRFADLGAWQNDWVPTNLRGRHQGRMALDAAWCAAFAFDVAAAQDVSCDRRCVQFACCSGKWSSSRRCSVGACDQSTHSCARC